MQSTNNKKQELFYKILNRGLWKDIPEREEKASRFIKALFHYLFPIQCSCMPDEMQLDQGYLNTYKFFRELYWPVHGKSCKTETEFEINFFNHLPEIYDLLIEDAEAIFKADPAAKTVEEVIHIYPGFYATFIYRVAHTFYNLNETVLARMLSEYAHSNTGIDIHPGATIGHSFGIDHGTGIVIGETSVIGNNVKIYQGVTLGAKNVAKALSATKRHPTIGDNVAIYAGATILGGDTIIGQNSVIGGNVFITHSIPDNSLVYYKNELAVKPLQKEFAEEVS